MGGSVCPFACATVRVRVSCFISRFVFLTFSVSHGVLVAIFISWMARIPAPAPASRSRMVSRSSSCDTVLFRISFRCWFVCP